MRTGSVILALALLTACRGLSREEILERTSSPPSASRTPVAEDLHGAWVSVTVRGAVADLGHTVLYVLVPGGTYTGAVVSDTEAQTLSGTWSYEDGELTLDDGALRAEASIVGDRLELTFEDSFLALERRAGGR